MQSLYYIPVLSIANKDEGDSDIEIDLDEEDCWE
jgi:hypothetical protein